MKLAEYLLAPTDELITLWRSKVKVAVGMGKASVSTLGHQCPSSSSLLLQVWIRWCKPRTTHSLDLAVLGPPCDSWRKCCWTLSDVSTLNYLLMHGSVRHLFITAQFTLW